jgi:RimJ/RimL family protein N-acetyltransferase
VSVKVLEPVRPARRVELDDGRELLVRRLCAADEPALRAALDHADPVDLRRRFLGPPPPVGAIVRLLRLVDDVHDLALGAFEADGRLVGVAQFDRLDDQPVAEIAIELGTAWQRHGLGRIMLDALAVEARALGITRLTASYYADNLPVRRLLHHTGRVVESGISAGEGYAVLDISAPAADCA